MSTELYIIGTGGAAKEIIQLIEQVNAVKNKFSIVGIVDVNCVDKSIDFFGKEYTLYNEENFLLTKKGASVVIANGAASVRQMIYNKFQEFNFPNIIHPGIDIHKTVQIGTGNIIKIGCILTTDIEIGDNNYINRGVQIGHDVVIGNHNVLNPGCIISGGVKLGGCNNLGANATILQYLSVGNGNTLGAGGVLIKTVESDLVLIGVPAKEK